MPNVCAPEDLGAYLRQRQLELAELAQEERSEALASDLRQWLQVIPRGDQATFLEEVDRLFPFPAFEPLQRRTQPVPPPPAQTEPTAAELVDQLVKTLADVPLEVQREMHTKLCDRLGLRLEGGGISVDELITALRQTGRLAAADPDRGALSADAAGGAQACMEQMIAEALARPLQGLGTKDISHKVWLDLLSQALVEIGLVYAIAKKLLMDPSCGDPNVWKPHMGKFRNVEKCELNQLLKRLFEGGNVADFRRGLRRYTGLPKSILNISPSHCNELVQLTRDLDPSGFRHETGFFRKVDSEQSWNNFCACYGDRVGENADAVEAWADRIRREFVDKIAQFLKDHYDWETRE